MRPELLLAYIARLGTSAAARALGVHPSTVRRWAARARLSQPLPQSESFGKAARKVSRSEASRKGRETRRAAKTWAEEARERLTLPPRQRPYERLTPDQILPTRDPRRDPRVRSVLRDSDARVGGGWIPFDNEYHEGEYAWFDLPEHQDFLSLNLESLREHVVQAWQQSGRTYARFLAVYAYAYADNPAYQGRLAHLKKLAHRWKAAVTTNRIASGRDGVAGLVDWAFFGEPRRMAPGAKRRGYSVETQAQTRVIYVLRYMISTFDRKREARESDFLS